MASNNDSATSTEIANSTTDVIIRLANDITVRRYRHSDIANLSHHATNKKVLKFMRNRMPDPYTQADAKWWIDLNTDPANFVGSGPWTPETGSQGDRIPTRHAIAIKDELVGTIGLEFNDPTDIYFRAAELGYWLSEDHWGKGIMSVVATAFVKWTWDTFGVLVRLNSDTHEHNVASRKCLVKAGFTVECLRKYATVKHGEIGNQYLLGAVRPGFETED